MQKQRAKSKVQIPQRLKAGTLEQKNIACIQDPPLWLFFQLCKSYLVNFVSKLIEKVLAV